VRRDGASGSADAGHDGTVHTEKQGITTMRTNVLTALIGVGAGLLAMGAQAGLVTTDGGLGVYDTTNNVTWTSNANLFATQEANYIGGAAAFVSAVIADSGGIIHDTPNQFDPTGTYSLSASDFNVHAAGQMTWWGAQAWVNYLNVTNYGGSSQWALPTTVDSISNDGVPNGAPGNPAVSSSQMAELFYGGLGEVAGSPITTTHNSSLALFTNTAAFNDSYWSGTEFQTASTNGRAWFFYPGALDPSPGDGGDQGGLNKDFGLYALAVSPGELSPVPLPGAAWLMLSGVGWLAVFARKKRFAA
jgi:hypothetical protein